ncbi:MAG: hypothetical protein R3B35_04000 [Gemmatimonadales bacterium]
MTRYLSLAALVLAAPLAAQQAAPSVTLFNSGQALVRRTLPVRLPAGTSTQPLVLGIFDPASFAVLDRTVQVAAVRYDGATTEDALLRRNIGQVFTFPQGDAGGVVRARLLAVDPERWEIVDAGATRWQGVVFARPGRLMWDASLVPLAPIADVTLVAERARDALPVMYRAPGGSWAAGYRVYLGASGRIEGTAQVNAGTLDLQNANVQLLAGDIGRQAQPMPMAMAREADFAGRGAQGGVVAISESVGEVKLYTLPGAISFTPGTQVVVPLFAPAAVAPELRLTVPGSLPFYGGIGQETDEVEVPVMVSYRLPHELKTPFGDLPLPAGAVSVFDTDAGGRVQLVGQGSIGHTAPGEQVEVQTGTAFDVSARRTQTEYATTRATSPTRVVATVGYSVTLKNAKDSAVTVEVREDRGGEWNVISSSVPAVRRSSSRTVFPVRVPAGGEATLTYRIRVVW